MPVFFLSPESITPPTVTISGELLRHLRDSLRVTEGEELLVGDGAGRRYRTLVTQVSRQAVTSRILDTQPEPVRRMPTLVLGQALLKGDKMDWVIQKATELGVGTIAPLQASRSIVRPKAGRIETLTARWQRIALEAAQQSEQWRVPAVLAPQSLMSYAENCPARSLRLILTERRTGCGSLGEIALPAETEDSITLLVGPEGGWTGEEAAAVERAGFLPISLGPTILRAETAAVAAIAVLQHRLGELG